MTPGHVAPAVVARVAGAHQPAGGSRVGRADCLGPGAGPVAGVVAAGLHRVGPRADDVGLPVGVRAGIERLAGCAAVGLHGCL